MTISLFIIYVILKEAFIIYVILKEVFIILREVFIIYVILSGVFIIFIISRGVFIILREVFIIYVILKLGRGEFNRPIPHGRTEPTWVRKTAKFRDFSRQA